MRYIGDKLRLKPLALHAVCERDLKSLSGRINAVSDGLEIVEHVLRIYGRFQISFSHSLCAFCKAV